MILGLRASAVYTARALGPSSCILAIVHKQARIRQEIISILRQVAIVGTLIHQSAIYAFPEDLLGLLFWVLRLRVREIACSNHKG